MSNGKKAVIRAIAISVATFVELFVTKLIERITAWASARKRANQS